MYIVAWLDRENLENTLENIIQNIIENTSLLLMYFRAATRRHAYFSNNLI